MSEEHEDYEEYNPDAVFVADIECDEDGNVIDQPLEYCSDDSVECVAMKREDIPPASEEQENIINLIKDYHVVVDSVAGCGKTTTVIHTAMKYPDQKILILMYNKRLKEETKIKMSSLSLNNVEVQNFHSFFVRHYEGESFTDIGLGHTISRNMSPKKPFDFDIIVIDEAQDMKVIFFRALCKIINDNRISISPPRIMILGDKFQNVYKFLGSDERFLLYSSKVFTMKKLAQVEWRSAKLSVSYRLTRQTALFVNKCVLGYDRIQAVKEGPLVKYIICNLFRSTNKIVKEMIDKYGYENIFIVSNSVRSGKSPLRNIANKMSEAGIPIYVPQSDDADIDSKVIEGKLVFTTYNQTKGLERECVIVFNIDEWNPHKGTEPPNAIYVAMTRAKTQLVLFHSNNSNYANFMKRNEIPKYSELKVIGKYKPDEVRPVKDLPAVPVAQLIEYLTGAVIDKACSYFTTKSGNDNCGTVSIPTTIINGDLYEEVSDITGIMIPAYYEYVTNGHLQIYTHMDVKTRAKINMPKTRVCSDKESISRLLHMANIYISSDSGYKHKLAQIKNYDWVTTEHLEMITPRLKKNIGIKNNDFEYRVESIDTIMTKKIMGSIDCVARFGDKVCRVYEFKCVSTLKRTHLIQLAIYAYLLETGIAAGKYTDITQPRDYILLNLLSGKHYRLKFNLSDLREMVEFLIIQKFFIKDEKSDKTFFQEIKDTILEFN